MCKFMSRVKQRHYLQEIDEFDENEDTLCFQKSKDGNLTAFCGPI